MRRLLGGSFFIAAAIYMAVSKPPDPVTLLAILLCTVCAALATTKQLAWSIITGGIMIAGSLAMQVALSYRCTDCLKADALILCGIMYLAVFDKSRFKLWTRGMAVAMTLILLVFFTLSAPVEQVLNANRYIQASDGKSDIVLDTAEKPVLLFNPKCRACGEVITRLVRIDPQGERWTPVQTGGSLQDGRDYLAVKGYNGKLYLTKWPGTVPALVTTQENNTVIIRSIDQILEKLSGA